MALTKAQFAKVVKARVFPLMPENANAILVTHSDRKDKQHEHFRELFVEGSSEITLDTDRTTLQWRILDYCTRQGWIKSPGKLLEKAFKSARKADVKQNRLRFLGGNQTEKTLEKLRKSFKRDEQVLCHQAAVVGFFSAPSTVRDFTALVENAYSKKRGKKLIEFLSALNSASERRGKGEIFNPRILVLSRLWVDANCPFWLLRTRLISKDLRSALPKLSPISQDSINTAIKDAKLFRLPEDTANKLFSRHLDDEGLALHKEIQDVTGVAVSNCFHGARPSR